MFELDSEDEGRKVGATPLQMELFLPQLNHLEASNSSEWTKARHVDAS